jgi:hypothetical protein
MSRPITFSRQFPAYHPRVGDATYFVEKIHKSLLLPGSEILVTGGLVKDFSFAIYSSCLPKHHTIRVGERWKAGDWFSPAVWGNDINPKSGRSGPYQSKQIKFAPDIQIKKVWPFELTKDEYILNGKKLNLPELTQVANNDGLECDDLELWFQKPFKGQVICWNENVNY